MPSLGRRGGAAGREGGREGVMRCVYGMMASKTTPTVQCSSVRKAWAFFRPRAFVGHETGKLPYIAARFIKKRKQRRVIYVHWCD